MGNQLLDSLTQDSLLWVTYCWIPGSNVIEDIRWDKLSNSTTADLIDSRVFH